MREAQGDVWLGVRARKLEQGRRSARFYWRDADRAAGQWRRRDGAGGRGKIDQGFGAAAFGRRTSGSGAFGQVDWTRAKASHTSRAVYLRHSGCAGLSGHGQVPKRGVSASAAHTAPPQSAGPPPSTPITGRSALTGGVPQAAGLHLSQLRLLHADEAEAALQLKTPCSPPRPRTSSHPRPLSLAAVCSVSILMASTMGARTLPSVAVALWVMVMVNQLRSLSYTRRAFSHQREPSLSGEARRCDKRIAKRICQRHSEGADVKLQNHAHEVDAKFSSDASHEVMAVLGGTIARLQGLQLRGLPTLETLAADLQRARRALKQALIQAGGVLEWRARGAHHRRRRLEQRASSFAVFPGSVRPLSTTWPWTIRPALAVLWGVCWQFYASGSFGSTGGDGGLALADAGSAGRVRAARLEWQLDLGWQGPRDGAYLAFGREAVATTLAQGHGQEERAEAEGPALDVRCNSNPPPPPPRRATSCATSRHVAFQDTPPQPGRNPRPQGSRGSGALPGLPPRRSAAAEPCRPFICQRVVAQRVARSRSSPSLPQVPIKHRHLRVHLPSAACPRVQPPTTLRQHCSRLVSAPAARPKSFPAPRA
ncbi:hypothetical protein B0J12DRAFT_86032 [Macrophomina phaseolina]|uniref:Uncharacterized protein n=1 Tax=Macrophomina phaseolina TaxID=35725 RepID=A0ABQ8FPJ8_9PEZI|nr:hypothetical protein B0J12DRAFT_86032 [Macrophomina phaseolina]